MCDLLSIIEVGGPPSFCLVFGYIMNDGRSNDEMTAIKSIRVFQIYSSL